MSFQLLSFQILSYSLWNHTEGLEEDGSFFFWHGRDQRTQTEHHNTMLSRTLDKFLNLLQKTDKKKPKLNNVHVTCIAQYCKLDIEQRKSMFLLCIDSFISKAHVMLSLNQHQTIPMFHLSHPHKLTQLTIYSYINMKKY